MIESIICSRKCSFATVNNILRINLKLNDTRMHSCRMRTARSLTVSRSICWGVYLLRRVYLPGGCTCQGGTCRGGYLARGEVYLPGGCTCPGEVYLPRGVYLPGGVPAWGGGGCTCPGVRGCTCLGGTCPGTAPPLCTEFLTHATENIILPQTSFAGSKDSCSR